MIKNYAMSLYKIIGLKKLYLLLVWVSIFSSLNLNPIEFESFTIILKIRLLLPLILILISFFILKFNYKALINFNILMFIIFIFFYSLFNLINIENPNSNLFWPIYMFLALLFIVSFVGDDEIKLIIKFTTLIIFIAFSIFMIFAVKYMIDHNIQNLYGMWGNATGYSVIIDYPPRSSGLARYAFILFTICYLCYLLESYSRNIKILLLILVSVFATFTILFQSRTITAIFFMINLLIIFIYYKEILKKKIILLFVIILPLVLSFSYEIWKNNKYLELENKSQDKKERILENFNNYLKYSIIRNQNNEDLNRFSSGRTTLWVKTIDIIKKNPLIGYGAQADRLYINESVHNALLYAWLSGGIISALFIIYCYIKISHFFFTFLKTKILRVNLFFSSSLFIMIIIALRSLLDTSFAIYGIDYLIFLITFYYVNSHITHNK